MEREKEKREGSKQGKGGKRTLFPAMVGGTLCAHSLIALAETVRHLIKVAIKLTFTEDLPYSRH